MGKDPYDFLDILSSILDRVGMAGSIDFSDMDRGVLSVRGKQFRLIITDSLDEFIETGAIQTFPDLSSTLFLTPEIQSRAFKKYTSQKLNFVSGNERMSLALDTLRMSFDGSIFMIAPIAKSSLSALGSASEIPVESQNLMTVSVLKVILCFLSIKESVNWPLRKVAEAADISLGSVQRSVQLLKAHSFIFTTPKGRFLKNRRQLLDLWTRGFNMILRPKNTLGRADFRVRPGERDSMQKIIKSLPDGYVWGGEPAAYLTDPFLGPELFSIFTSATLRDTCIDCSLIPRPRGNVEILKKFWTDEIPSDRHAAPLPVVYAQLRGTDDSRCQEAAERLLAHENFAD